MKKSKLLSILSAILLCLIFKYFGMITQGDLKDFFDTVAVALPASIIVVVLVSIRQNKLSND